MVSDSDLIVGIDEQDLDCPETRIPATPSLSTRQPSKTQIRWWPELDRLLVARPPPPKPSSRCVFQNDPSRSAGRNGETAPAHQCLCRSSSPTGLDSHQLDSR